MLVLEVIGASGYPVSLCGSAPANQTFSRVLLCCSERKLFVQCVCILAGPLDVIHEEVELGIFDFLKAICKVTVDKTESVAKDCSLLWSFDFDTDAIS